jgi:tetratricopeptide (TPR) repeat protein
MAPPTTTKPTTFDAAFRDATAIHQSGRIAEAAARYEALLPSAAEDPQLRYLLGAAYVELNRFSDAVASLDRARVLRPGHAPTIEMLGSAWLRAGAPEKSLPYFLEADQLAGGTPETSGRLANALRLAGRFTEAAAAYRRATSIHPPPRQASVGLAMCLAALGDTPGAEEILRKCLEEHPDYASAYLTLASLLGQTERFVEAEQVAGVFLSAHPTHLEARRVIANAIHKQGRLGDAVAIYREILRDDPANQQTALQLAEALIDLSRLEEAESILSSLRNTGPARADVVTALGRIQELRGDLETAIATHTEAIALDPACENAYVNRGSAKRFGGAFDDALADYDAALAIRPHFPPAVANRGLTLLILGRLQEAWPLYRSRIKALQGAPDLTGGKPWDGSSLRGKKVLVWLEYGLGDEILFANLLPELIDAVAQCTIVCSPRLRTLFMRSFPRARVIGFGSEIPDDVDVRLPLTDAAQWLRPTTSSFPKHSGYIKPDAGLVADLRARYREDGAARLVGLSWRSASGPAGRFKSMDLAQWSELLELPGATFVSLQYGDCADEIADASRRTGRTIIHDRSIDLSGDLDGFAAQVAAMDLVISVSNTTVHVAGALGRPVWALVPTGPGAHWYWFLNRPDNPWYPSLRLFRQDRGSDWKKPLAHVKDELATWLRS